MCGILGMLGTVSEENYSAAHELLANIFKASVTRGGDSSGFSAIHLSRPGVLITDKRPLASPRYVKRASRFKSLKRDMPNILIAHTRLSTSGSPRRNRNNHPFNGKRYTLVHNGGISDWQSQVRKLEIQMRTETDSEMLLHLMENGTDPHDAIQEMMDKVGRGSRIAIAAIDYKAEDPSLILFRNRSNDVYIMTHVGFNVIYFASTRAILEQALDNTFGAYATEHVDENKVEIDRMDPFVSHVIRVNKDDGAPYIVSDKNIVEYTPTPRLLPSRSSSYPTHPIRTASTIAPSTPVSDNSSVFKAIKSGKVSKETRANTLRLTRVTRKVGEICRSIRENEFMTPEEVRDYEEWKTVV